MQRQLLVDQNSSAEVVLPFITNQTDASTIEWIYQSDPDIFFSGDNTNVFLSCAREVKNSSSMEILNILFSQYTADKIRLKKWDKLVNCCLSVTRYFAHYKEFASAKGMLEYALFYLQKKSIPGVQDRDLDTRKLEIEKLLAGYCTENFKTLKYTDLNASLEDLLLAKNCIQQLLAVKFKIQAQTNDLGKIEYCCTIYSFILQKIGIYYCAEAYAETQQLDSEILPPGIHAYIRSSVKYRDALMHYELAKKILENSRTQFTQSVHNYDHLLQVLADGIEKTKNIRNTIAQSACFVPNDATDLQYLKNKLCVIVADRNNGVAEVVKFIEEYQIDENIFDTINGFTQVTAESPIPFEAKVIESIIQSGNLDTLQPIFQRYLEKISLLPSINILGLMNCINEFTLPEVEAYLLDYNHYRNHPQYVRIEFFIAAMRGDLEKVRAHLILHPHDIVYTPESNVTNEIAKYGFILYAANHFYKSNVIRYLEKYINSYVELANGHLMVEHLKDLYRGMSNCYFKFGWDKKRRAAFEKTAEQCINICSQQLVMILSIPTPELTPDHKRIITDLQFEILDIRFEMGIRSETEGDNKPKIAHQLFQRADDIYQKIIADLAKIDRTLLLQFNGTEEVIKYMQDASVRIKSKLNPVISDDKNNTDEKPISILPTHTPGSFATSSSMFPAAELPPSTPVSGQSAEIKEQHTGIGLTSTSNR